MKSPWYTRRSIVCIAAVICVLAGAFIVSTWPANAQRTSRDLTGIVTDASHEPLSGAIVEIEDENLKTVRSYLTDRTGRYTFLRLDGSVDFKVWATFRGHQSPARTLSLFDTGSQKTLDLMIHLQ